MTTRPAVNSKIFHGALNLFHCRMTYPGGKRSGLGQNETHDCARRRAVALFAAAALSGTMTYK
jgi:hypothetical protein